MAEGSSSLGMNELLKVLQNEPTLSNNLKDVCKKLKTTNNHWQDSLKLQWSRIVYPIHDQASIYQMNTYMNKHVEGINIQRKNQRAFFVANGNPQAAHLLPDMKDDSCRDKSAIIISDYQTLGWDPTAKAYITICYTKKPLLSDLHERIESCQYSKAINVPKSLSNILMEGVDRGYTAQNYASIFLQFIHEYIPNSYLSALTYNRNVEALFQYLLALVDTSSEVKKVRIALSSVTRQIKEPLSEATMRVKALTNSLLYMMNPNNTVEEVNKRSDYAAQDSIYSFVTNKTKNLLMQWKRSANQMQKKITLQEFLEAANNFELLPGNAPTDILTIPDRFSQADLWSNSFYSKNGIVPETYKQTHYQDKQREKKGEDQRKKDDRNKEKRSYSSGNEERGRKTWKDRGEKSRSQSVSSREQSRGRQQRQQSWNKEGSQGREQRRGGQQRQQSNQSSRNSSGGGRSNSGRRDERNPDRHRKGRENSGQNSSSSKPVNREYRTCKKCGGNHKSADCNRYPFFYNEKCSKGCGFYHPSNLCRFNQSRYRTPERAMNNKSPVSFEQNDSAIVKNIFSTNVPKN